MKPHSPRIIKPEFLDSLPPGSPEALRSRRDLHRVNGWMRNHAVMAAALRTECDGTALREITELGAGDGRFLLRVAKKLSSDWPEVKATLLDLNNSVDSKTLAAFTSLGWRARAVVADVFDWPQSSDGDEVVIANLFLHHFEDVRLMELFQTISQRAKLFIAVEPHRFRYAWASAQLLRLLGCSAVTLHDGAASIQAGFILQEISQLWPDRQSWQLSERRAGFFSHLFIARRIR